MEGFYVNLFKERLKRNGPDQTIELARLVEGLTEHPGWEVIHDLVDQYVADIDQMLEVSIHDQAVYAARIGERRGMRAVRQAVQAVQEQAKHAEQELLALAQEIDRGN